MYTGSFVRYCKSPPHRIVSIFSAYFPTASPTEGIISFSIIVNLRGEKWLLDIVLISLVVWESEYIFRSSRAVF